MNFVETKCKSCKQKMLMSYDEKRQFGYGYCWKCIDPKVRHIRAKIVLGFYDIDSITTEIANKLVERELNGCKKVHND